jgi:segregation and condensation protein A
MLEARRYRGAAAYLEDRLADEPQVRFRQAALPVSLRRRSLEEVDGAIWNPASLGRAIGGLLAVPAKLDLRHIGATRVTVGERLAHLRALLKRVSAVDFDEAVRGADRMTVAMTVFALLELYKQGEADWSQDEPFSQITIRPAATG